ncbi:MAG: ROK family protein [Actinobacteria bacterium]|nr:ROK family protein [Actinomycetota bacterium]
MNVPTLSLGLDVGGTKTHGIVLGSDHRILAECVRPTRPSVEGVRVTVLEVAHNLAAQLGISCAAFTSVGVGIPGIVTHRTGQVRTAVNLDIESTNLVEVLGSDFTAPVCVENDVKATALGAWTALSPRAADLCYLNLGTGMAAAAVISGRLIRGARNGAGEIGHLAFYPAGELCSCGQRGCLETVAGGLNILRRFREHGLDLATLDTSASPQARAERRQLVAAVATALTLVAITYDCAEVLVGGGVARTARWLLPSVTDELRHQAQSSGFLTGLAVADRLSELPDSLSAPAIGAAVIGRAPAHLR